MSRIDRRQNGPRAQLLITAKLSPMRRETSAVTWYLLIHIQVEELMTEAKESKC